MFNFKLPRDIENIITINLTILFFFAFFYMTYTDGQVTIKYIDEYEGLSPQDYEIFDENLDIGIANLSINLVPDFTFQDTYRKYRKDLGWQGNIISHLNFYLFFVFLPLIDIFYGIWCFKKGLMWLPKSLYRSPTLR